MNRRNFLRGACGVAVALPLLESLNWRRFTSTAKAAVPGTKRLAVFFTCNGVNLDWPSSTNAAAPDTTAADMLVPLIAT